MSTGRYSGSRVCRCARDGVVASKQRGKPWLDHGQIADGPTCRETWISMKFRSGPFSPCWDRFLRTAVGTPRGGVPPRL